jgi:hypothetical protein
MERSYKFMIRHVRLWKVAFHGTSPRWVHGMYLAALAYFYAKYARTQPSQLDHPIQITLCFRVSVRPIDSPRLTWLISARWWPGS